MRRFFFICAYLITFGFCMNVNAQPQWGQMPSTNPTFKDINYAGDGLEAHNLDIYLPENQQSPSKVVVIIYGSACLLII